MFPLLENSHVWDSPIWDKIFVPVKKDRMNGIMYNENFKKCLVICVNNP